MEQHIVINNGQAQDLLRKRIKDMRKIIVCLFVLLVSQISYSQIENKVSKNLFKLNILTPGLTYEYGISDKTTLNVDVNLSIDAAVSNGQIKLLTSPFVRTQYRYYYNLDSRISKSKSVLGNSSGFIAPSISYYAKPIGDDLHVSGFDGLTLGGVWGFQKTYKFNLNIGANAGLGYNFSSNVNSTILPILNFTIAWVFLK